jgi:hypothetical protein
MSTHTNPTYQTSIDTPFHGGLATINAALDIAHTQRLNDSEVPYYHPSGRDEDVYFNVERKEIAFIIAGNQVDAPVEEMMGIPQVQTSFNNIARIPSMNKSLNEIQNDLVNSKAHLPVTPECIIRDLVASDMKLLGVSYGEVTYRSVADKKSNVFALQISGIVHLRVSKDTWIGAMLKAEPPLPTEWEGNSGRKRKKGLAAGKLLPVLTPVFPEDLGNSMERNQTRCILGKTSPLTNISMFENAINGRAHAEQQFSDARVRDKKFSILMGILGLLQQDVLQLSDKFNPQDTSTAHRQAYLAYDMERLNFLAPKEKFNNQRVALGLCLSPAQHGFSEDTTLYPEEIVMILAQMIGLHDANTKPVPSQTTTRSTAVGTRADYIARNLSTKPEWDRFRKGFQQWEFDFLHRSFFCSAADNRASRTNAPFEFGYMNYERLPRLQIARSNANDGIRGAHFIRGIKNGSIAGVILSYQQNATQDLAAGFQNMLNSLREKIVGRALRSSKANEMCDVLLAKAY